MKKKAVKNLCIIVFSLFIFLIFSYKFMVFNTGSFDNMMFRQLRYFYGDGSFFKVPHYDNKLINNAETSKEIKKLLNNHRILRTWDRTFNYKYPTLELGADYNAGLYFFMASPLHRSDRVYLRIDDITYQTDYSLWESLCSLLYEETVGDIIEKNQKLGG